MGPPAAVTTGMPAQQMQGAGRGRGMPMAAMPGGFVQTFRPGMQQFYPQQMYAPQQNAYAQSFQPRPAVSDASTAFALIPCVFPRNIVRSFALW